MYAQVSVERAEYRRANRERVRRQQEALRKLLIGCILALLIFFACAIRFGTMLTNAKGGSEEQGYKYYSSIEVESGDSLWGIADRYMDSAHYITHKEYINEVMVLNHMVSDRLVIGQKLTVPYYSTELK